MSARKNAAPRLLSKVATGLRGFDEISRGGLPRNRTSLVMGGPGTGKTVFALQALVNAARERKQPGIFVAFEEGAGEIFANAATFGWGLPALAKSALFFLDARSYLVRGGERNRALTIVKSRGTRHSNQVRELVLSAAGPALADVYSSGGEVLMGTLRSENEAEERARTLQRRAEFTHKRRELQFAEADIAARITALQLELDKQRAELALYTSDDEARHVSSEDRENELRRMRSADGATPAAPVPGKRRVARISARSRGNGGKEPRRGA